MMMDDKDSVGKRDRERINIREHFEVFDWATKFGVSQERLKEAVKKVGPMVADVKKELGL